MNEGKAVEKSIRKSLRDGFEGVIITAYNSVDGMDVLAPVMMQSAMSDFYQSVKSNDSLRLLGSASGINFEEILEEEAQLAYEKYFK
ncbi:hypothetical protein D0T50_05660 [Bacteroides sp. 214]|uniref:hypothetical protein n=1 Tax=Bacteroides sp. 214 TaxID=2302935 RepID=UPI0013CF7C70|nr:hypothetical protein [Bacteroides sp. 214]NDW12375.1 hypothetical protein [Bacteroides sp. 214]